MKELEEIFGIKIDNSDFFVKALTHPSYTKEQELPYTENYERLEFLGDAVLKLLTSEILYNTFPDYPEGNLSKIRSIVVSDNTSVLADNSFSQSTYEGYKQFMAEQTVTIPKLNGTNGGGNGSQGNSNETETYSKEAYNLPDADKVAQSTGL